MSFLQLVRDRFFLIVLLIALPVWLLVYATDVLPFSRIEMGWIQLALLALVYPVLEELVFRGLIQGYLLQQPRLAERYLHLSAANGITSLLFSLFHIINQPVGIALLVFFPSLIFGELRERFNATIPSIFLHIYYNLGLLLVLSSKVT